MTGALAALGLEQVIGAAIPSGAPENRPGLVVGLYQGGELQDWWATGNASLEYSVPISSGTVFDIASCAKQFTAAVAVMLADEGVVDLDADVRDVVPELRLSGVTLRRCLTHTTGLNDYMTANELAGRSLGDMVDQRDFLRWLSSAATTCFTPGDSISYSNSGYVLAAIVLARASGRSFSELVADRIFRPLEMSKSRIHDLVGAIVPDLAFSYSLDGERLAREEMVECQVGDGAVLTTVEDLAPWHRFLLDGYRLGGSVRDAILTRARLTSGAECGYAMGVMHRQVDGVPVYGHGGSMYGYRSTIVCIPSLGVGITILANWGDLPVQAIAKGLAQRVVRAGADAVSEGTVATTPAAPPAGVWLDVVTGRVLDVEVTDDSVSIDQLRLVLRPVDGSWQDDYGDFELAVDPTTLTLIDRMGSRATLQPAPEATVDPDVLRGHYRAPDLDRDLIVDASGEDQDLQLVVVGGQTWKLGAGYQVDGVELFPLQGGGVVLRRHDNRITLSMWEVAADLVPVAQAAGDA